MKRIFRALEITAVLFFILLAVMFLPSVFNPGFVVNNTTSRPVMVTALWREQSRDLGEIEAAASHRFNVSDEAAMTFRVTYPDGRILESNPIYFSNGLTVVATITEDAVKVDYDD